MVRTNTLAVAALACTIPVLCQTPSTVWDGVYTADQAERGQIVYSQHCAVCHGQSLEGDAQTDRAKKLNRALPPLAGDVFTGNWNNRPLSDLFDKIAKTMPWDDPGKISRKDNADLVAYVLRFNRFPAGAKELPTESDVLADIMFFAVKPKQ